MTEQCVIAAQTYHIILEHKAQDPCHNLCYDDDQDAHHILQQRGREGGGGGGRREEGGRGNRTISSSSSREALTMTRRTVQRPAAPRIPMSDMSMVTKPAIKMSTLPEAMEFPVTNSRLLLEASRYIPSTSRAKPTTYTHTHTHTHTARPISQGENKANILTQTESDY